MKLNLTDHAVKQLNKRWPSWSKSGLIKALKSNPWFEAGGETHTYIGTGFDTFEPKLNKVRPTYKTRHLFLVTKKDAKTGVLFQPTVVFHTNTSIKNWLQKPGVTFNSDTSIPNFIEKKDFAEAISVYVITNDPLSARNDLLWEYHNKFFIRNKYIM